MKIFVASDNPVKINSILQAASETYPEVEVQGLKTPSGISEQPMTDEETMQGSINRAKNIAQIAKDKHLFSNDETVLFVGAEGGVFPHPNNDQELWSTVWITVLDQAGQTYSANGARFRLPSFLSEGILSGQEMGAVIGQFCGDPDQKRKAGAIGIITANFVDRTEEYVGIAKLALGLWHGRHWQEKK